MPAHQRRSRQSSGELSRQVCWPRPSSGTGRSRSNSGNRSCGSKSRTQRHHDHVTDESVSLDAPKLYDLYEKICELDVPIFVHPALAPIGYDLLQDYDLPRVLGREVDLTVATTRLIAGGVLDRFPDLKLVIAHFGGGIAAMKDRLLAKGYRFGTLKRPFADYFDMLYFDLAGFEGGLAALHCALQGIRPERLLFASDYPQDFTGVNTDTGRGMKELKAYIDAVRALALSDATKEAILGRTAAQLLKL